MAYRTDGPGSPRSIQPQPQPRTTGGDATTGQMGGHKLARTQPQLPPPPLVNAGPPVPLHVPQLPRLPDQPPGQLQLPGTIAPTPRGHLPTTSAGGNVPPAPSGPGLPSLPPSSLTRTIPQLGMPQPSGRAPTMGDVQRRDSSGFGDEALFRFGSDDDGVALEDFDLDESDFRFGSEEDPGPSGDVRDLDGPGRRADRSDNSSMRRDARDDTPKPQGPRRQERFGKPSPQPLPTAITSSTAQVSSTTVMARPKAVLVKVTASQDAIEAMKPKPRTSSQLIHAGELLQDLGVGRTVGVMKKSFKTPLSAYLANLHEPVRPQAFQTQLARLDDRLQKAEQRIDRAIAESAANRPPPSPDERAEARTTWAQSGKKGNIEDYLPKSSREEALLALKNQIAADRQLIVGISQGPPPPPDSGLSLSQFIEMRRLGFPDDAAADMATFNQSRELSRAPLGSGVVNVTDRVVYKGVPEEQVYKAAEPSVPPSVDVVGAVGIDYRKPLLANRNMASVAMDKELGLGLLPETRFASKDNEVGVVMTLAKGTQPGKTCLLPTTKQEAAEIQAWEQQLQAGTRGPDEFQQRMESKGFAIGKDGLWCKKSTVATEMNTKDPKLLQLLSNLEWLDKLTGQVDRHMNNYLVETDDDGNVIGLVGIDNDFAFGKDSLDPAPLTKGTGEPARMGHQIRGLPLLIDSDTATSIEKMAANWHAPGGMKAKLSALLPPAEVAAAETRLFATKAKDGFTGLLEHVQQLRSDKRVVPHDQWDSWRDPQTGKSAYGLLTADLSSPQGQKWPQVENTKSYVAVIEAEARSRQELDAERF